MATSYRGIGSRRKHRRTGIDIRPLAMIFSRGPTRDLTNSLVHFQVQSSFLLKFEEPPLGVLVQKALQLARVVAIVFK